MAKKEEIKITALYERLSRDDEQAGESNSIEGWTAFSNPRIFAKYGRQRGWERADSGNELSATGSDLPDGFRELTEEEAQQIEIPF